MPIVKTKPIDYYYADKIESILQECDQYVLKEKYHIPSEVEIRLPRRGEKPSNPLNDTVAICRKFFDCGLRLPMQYLRKC